MRAVAEAADQVRAGVHSRGRSSQAALEEMAGRRGARVTPRHWALEATPVDPQAKAALAMSGLQEAALLEVTLGEPVVKVPAWVGGLQTAGLGPEQAPA